MDSTEQEHLSFLKKERERHEVVKKNSKTADNVSIDSHIH